MRPGGKRDGQFEFALLAMAQPGNDDVAAMSEPDPIQRRLCCLAEMGYLAGVTPEVEGVTVMGLSRQRDVVQRGEVR